MSNIISNLNIVSVLLVLIFLYPILKGLLFRFSSDFAKDDINGMVVSLSLIIGIILSIYFSQKIFIRHDSQFFINIYNKIPKLIMNKIDKTPVIVYVIIVPILTVAFYTIMWKILNFIAKRIIYPLICTIEAGISKLPIIFRRIIGMIVQIPRALCYILVAAMILNIYTVVYKNNKINNELAESKVYNIICRQVIIPVTNSNLAKQLPSIINNSFKIQIKQNDNIAKKANKQSSGQIIYYNGVTLDEAVKSDASINNFAKKITANLPDDRQKAKKIYTWIGQNISYDDDKAYRVMNNDFSKESGAIPTFETRKGICFDYASLYVAMCKSCNIKTRIITGQGYNGVTWVSHAWNQVYISNEGAWINVDPTFYRGGNYFDSKNFLLDHRSDGVAGEW